MQSHVSGKQQTEYYVYAFIFGNAGSLCEFYVSFLMIFSSASLADPLLQDYSETAFMS